MAGDAFYLSRVGEASGGKLSARAVTILNLISHGRTDKEILERHPEFSAEDISLSAAEALLLNKNTQTRDERVRKIQQRYPRAYAKWSPWEEERIVHLYKEGKTMREIAAVIERQPNAVKSRLERLGLFRDPR